MSTYTFPQRRAVEQNKPNSEVLTSTYANTPLHDVLPIVLGKIGSDVLNETLTIDTVINSGVSFTMRSKGVTDRQLLEFGRRALRGMLNSQMTHIIMDEPSFDNIMDGSTDAIKDNRYYNTMLRVVWVIAKDIIV